MCLRKGSLREKLMTQERGETIAGAIFLIRPKMGGGVPSGGLESQSHSFLVRRGREA